MLASCTILDFAIIGSCKQGLWIPHCSIIIYDKRQARHIDCSNTSGEIPLPFLLVFFVSFRDIECWRLLDSFALVVIRVRFGLAPLLRKDSLTDLSRSRSFLRCARIALVIVNWEGCGR